MTRFAGLHVGLVGPMPPPAGGIANQTAQLAELLRAEGAMVEVVSTSAPYRPAMIAKVRLVRSLFRLLPYVGALWRAGGRSDLFHVMASSGWSWHLFAVPALWIARLRGVPIVLNYRGGNAANFLARSHRLVRFSIRHTGARLVVPSGFLKNVFARFGIGAEIVPNIVDVARFHRRAMRDRSDAHIVVARSLEPVYDNETALRSFRLVRDRLPNARLTIAGEGSEARRLRRVAAEIGVDQAVRFAGHLDHREMAALYCEADLVINPSLVDNMPNSLLEAMASGVPVVSTNVGGVPYVVQDGVTALLVPPSHPRAMADAALAVLESPSMWSRLSSAAFGEVQRYTWSRVGVALVTLYREVVELRGGR